MEAESMCHKVSLEKDKDTTFWYVLRDIYYDVQGTLRINDDGQFIFITCSIW